MPIIKSAKKRVKVAAKANARNDRTKRAMRDALKAFAKALEGQKTDQVAKAEHAAVKAIDQAAKKAIIHKNKAARYKSRLAKQAKTAGVKPSKSVAKKAATPTKKSMVKRPAAKK